MKFNKWTLGLATVGAVSFASAVRADEAPKMSQIQTALSNTTISGYVDVAAQYNPGDQHLVTSQQPAGAGTSSLSAATKPDSFTLNNVTVSIDHPQDDTPWASGYHVDLNWGADAINGTASTASGAVGAVAGGNTTANAIQQGLSFGVRQAYVVVRTPLGNGIDWKFGVMDDIIGYEGNTDGANPNYTRSIGYFVEPTTLTGLVGAYKVSSLLTVQGGMADSTSGNGALSSKTFVGSVALTAPDNWGWLKGSTINAGTVLNLEKLGQCNYYVGGTFDTPWSALKLGAALDIVSVANSGTGGSGPSNDSGWVGGVYANYQATDKLSVNARGEYFNLTGAFNPYTAGINPSNGKGEELTATVQYNLWANVISRVEVRWDHVDEGVAFNGTGAFASGGGPSTANSYLLAVNLIYQF